MITAQYWQARLKNCGEALQENAFKNDFIRGIAL
jgi:hypothetical protein